MKLPDTYKWHVCWSVADLVLFALCYVAFFAITAWWSWLFWVLGTALVYRAFYHRARANQCLTR